VVVGAAIVERAERAEDPEAAISAVARIVSDLKAPLREPR
jgi:tryptophan synthase alpha subunit